MKDWKELETKVMELLIEDSPRQPPSSGATKKEEDVVGSTTISQCKYTENLNLSLLEKDISRLLEAAKLQEKVPLFFNANSKHLVCSIIIDDSICIGSILELIMIYKKLDKLLSSLSITTDLHTLRLIREEYKNTILLYDKLKNNIRKQLVRIDTRINSKYDDLTMTNLFDEVPNATK